MSQISEGQKKCINTLMSKQKLQATRKAIISGASGERTESSSELTFDEANQLIKYLKGRDKEEQAADKMRKKIIAMAYEYAKIPANGTAEEKKETVARLNEWCIQYGYLHKELNKYTYAELPKLVTQFQHVLSDYFKRL